jgi:parallel beta-helix repeat protein
MEAKIKTNMNKFTLKFYVAKNGSDRWSGKIPSPDKNKKDGPFLTLEKAIYIVRKLKKQTYDAKTNKHVIVFIRTGIYFLSKPLVFTPEDSDITFTNYKNEKVIISGGKSIEKWEKTNVNGKNLWKAKIPEVKNKKWYFSQIWVNEKRQTRTRYPKKGYFKIEQIQDPSNKTNWQTGQTNFYFKKTDLKEAFNVDNTEIVIMNKWVESRAFIKNIDRKRNIISFDRPTVFKPEAEDIYYLENIFEFLDSPHEWYLNRQTGTLYYLPDRDEQIDKNEIIAPVLSQIIRLEGKPEKEKFVENIIFNGLIFSHTEWRLSTINSGSDQAAVSVPGAVYGKGVKKCTFINCHFINLGTYGIEIVDGCSNNKIIGCQFSDLGAGGIKIGESIRTFDEKQKTKNLHTYSNSISNCQIHNGGLLFHSAIGIWIGQSYKNYIRHNHIHDFYYSGISIGWTWGYGPTLAKENIVEFNHIHHIGVLSNGDGPILSDMGGIYTLGVQPGTLIRYNIIHDVAGFKYGGWGIYFDEGSSHIVAENNIVYYTTHGGFHQHYGKENIVRNNIFAFARDQQIQITKSENHLSFTFEHNIVYYNKGKLILMIDADFKKYILAFDYNLYWNETKSEITINNFTFKQWQKKGMDKHSVIADPFFSAVKNFDFRLRRNSPAFKTGFKDFFKKRLLQ